MNSRSEDFPLAVEIQRTEESLHLYIGLVQALEKPQALLDAVLHAEDDDAALTALSDRFGLDKVQARAVLDLQFLRATNRGRQRIEQRRQELADRLTYLGNGGER